MKKLLLILLSCLLMAACSAEGTVEAQARDTLSKLGITMTDAAFDTFLTDRAAILDAYKSIPGIDQDTLDYLLSSHNDVRTTARDLVIHMGVTQEMYEADENQTACVYAFDAEVFDVEIMYTLFLEGVDAMVPEVEFTEITEDLSKVTASVNMTADGLYTDGVRSVSFLCNGNPYTLTAVSYTDWFDMDMIAQLNGVLAREGCAMQLHEVASGWDQMVILVYGDAAFAHEVDAALGGSIE